MSLEDEHDEALARLDKVVRTLVARQDTARAEEREACAQVVEWVGTLIGGSVSEARAKEWAQTAGAIAAAIRARGQGNGGGQ